MKVNDLVVYIPKGIDGEIYKCEIGRIKKIDEENQIAFVYYHSGDTAARTLFEDLKVIDNQQYIEKVSLGGEE